VETRALLQEKIALKYSIGSWPSPATLMYDIKKENLTKYMIKDGMKIIKFEFTNALCYSTCSTTTSERNVREVSVMTSPRW
jgi:hypothetical protein